MQSKGSGASVSPGTGGEAGSGRTEREAERGAKVTLRRHNFQLNFHLQGTMLWNLGTQEVVRATCEQPVRAGEMAPSTRALSLLRSESLCLAGVLSTWARFSDSIFRTTQ